jgi:hypothetical protein
LSNCTSNIRLHIKHIGSARPWDWQLLVNGSIDEHAYELGAIDTSLPFVELKRLSHINDRARAADRDPAFSSRIRDGLPGIAIPLVKLRSKGAAIRGFETVYPLKEWRS